MKLARTLTEAIANGFVIAGISLEYNDPNGGRDFVVLHEKNGSSIYIDGAEPTTKLVSYSEDIASLVCEYPVTSIATCVVISRDSATTVITISVGDVSAELTWNGEVELEYVC